MQERTCIYQAFIMALIILIVESQMNIYNPSWWWSTFVVQFVTDVQRKDKHISQEIQNLTETESNRDILQKLVIDLEKPASQQQQKVDGVSFRN